MKLPGPISQESNKLFGDKKAAILLWGYTLDNSATEHWDMPDWGGKYGLTLSKEATYK